MEKIATSSFTKFASTTLLALLLVTIPTVPFMIRVNATAIRSDVNSDGIVNIKDLAQVTMNFGQNVPPAPSYLDIDGNGIINVKDVVYVLYDWGDGSGTPETGTPSATATIQVNAGDGTPFADLMYPDHYPGGSFTVYIDVNSVTNLYAFQVGFKFNPNVLQVKNVSEGGFLSSAMGAYPVFRKGTIDNTTGIVTFCGVGLLATESFIPQQSGSGHLLKIDMEINPNLDLDTYLGTTMPMIQFDQDDPNTQVILIDNFGVGTDITPTPSGFTDGTFRLSPPWQTLGTPVTTSVNGQEVVITGETAITIDPQSVHATETELTFTASAPPGTTGYINVLFPWVPSPFHLSPTIIIDGGTVTPTNMVIRTNATGPGTYYFICFELTFSTHTITIQFEPISATLDIDPDCLNLRGVGQWITAYVELPEGFDVNNINVSSILLNNTVPATLSAPVIIGDYNNNGTPDLMIKFDRRAVIDLITPNYEFTAKTGTAELTLTGRLNDGYIFQGIDTIKVILYGTGVGRAFIT